MKSSHISTKQLVYSYTISLRNVTGGFFFYNGTRTLDFITSTFNILYIQTMIFCIYNLAITCFVFPGQHILFCIIKPWRFVPKLKTPHFVVHVFLFCVFRPPQSSAYSHHSLSFSWRTLPGNSHMPSFHQPPNASPSSRSDFDA